MFSSPAGTKMFQFPAFASTAKMPWMTAKGCRVVPFGYLRVKGRLRLTGDFRSLPRPSSPPRAKASAVRPCTLLIPNISSQPSKKSGKLIYLSFITSPLASEPQGERTPSALVCSRLQFNHKPVIYFVRPTKTYGLVGLLSQHVIERCPHPPYEEERN